MGYTIFGEVAEGFDVLEKLNNLYCDDDGRPYQDVRINHTYVLEDTFDDPAGLIVPPASPVRGFPDDEVVKRRIAYEDEAKALESSAQQDQRSLEEIEKSIKEKEAYSRAMVLEMTGDIPDAEVSFAVCVFY